MPGAGVGGQPGEGQHLAAPLGVAGTQLQPASAVQEWTSNPVGRCTSTLAFVAPFLSTGTLSVSAWWERAGTLWRVKVAWAHAGTAPVTAMTRLPTTTRILRCMPAPFLGPVCPPAAAGL